MNSIFIYATTTFTLMIPQHS